MAVSITDLSKRLRQSLVRMIATFEEQPGSPTLMDLTIDEVMADLDPGMLGWRASSETSTQLEEGRNHAAADR